MFHEEYPTCLWACVLITNFFFNQLILKCNLNAVLKFETNYFREKILGET